MLSLCVECQKTAGENFPRRFGWPEAMRDVVEIDDWWPGEDHCYFRVRANDGALYILRHNEEVDSWELIFFELPDSNRVAPQARGRQLLS